MAQPLLSPINDYVFKRVFGENLTVLAAFLSAVLGIAIRGGDLAVIDPNFRANRAKDHLGILDVRVKTQQYGIIDVEIQVKVAVYLWNRFQYYTARNYVEQMRSGRRYESLSKAITIVIMDANLIHEDTAYHHCFHLYDKKHGLDYPDSMEIHILEIVKRYDDGDPVYQWLQFLAARTEEEFMSLAQNNPAMEEAWGVIKYLSGDEQERALAEAEERERLDRASLYDAGKAEGRAEGWKDGKAEVAQNLLHLGLPIAQIAEATGLSTAEIEALRKVQ